MRAVAWPVNRLRTINLPVLVQEMRIRMRGAKSLWAVAAYVMVLGAITLLVLGFAPNIAAKYGNNQPMARLGRELLGTLSVAQLVLIMLIVPSYSAANIAREREHRTFDLLALTLISSSSIVKQKQGAATFQALMLVFASLPVVAIVFMLGGVSPQEVLLVYGVLIGTAALLGGLGTFCSCLFRRAVASIFATYVAVVLLYAGIPFCLAWLEWVGSTGVSNALAQSPLNFTIMFAFAGAIPALIVYGVAALILASKTRIWRTRAFRMAVFGGSYALLLFVLSSESILGPFIGQGHGLSVLYVANPFVALVGLLEASEYGHGPTWLAFWSPIFVTAFSLGMAYILERLSAGRFNALRTV